MAANQLDFFGQGTLDTSFGVPDMTPEEQQAALRARNANLGVSGGPNLPGQTVNQPVAPGSTLADPRGGTFLDRAGGDTARILGGAAQTLTNPLGLIDDYTRQPVSSFANPVGKLTGEAIQFGTNAVAGDPLGQDIDFAGYGQGPSANGTNGALGDVGRVGGLGGGLGGLGGGGGGQTAPQIPLNQQINVPRQNAFDITAQGQGVNAQQQGTAAGFQQQAANFNPQAQSVAGQFGVGQRQGYSQMGGVQQVNPGSLGGVSNVAGQLGAAPGNIAGRLGGAPTIGNVGNIAGQLGAAPQVGDVGNIQMGAGPGNIAGLLSNMGQSSEGQAGMMQRLEGFLDQEQGPSIAQAQLQQAQADNMAQLIGAARSGRGGAGSQAQALRGAISEGGAIASDTAGQMATLRAQEEDMLRNRQLAGIGLGGQLATSMRGQDIDYRGQDLGALMSDQATQLGTRGQDLQGAMANQSTQTALEGLRANTALGARGQNLSALQGDQSTQAQLAAARGQLALGARGQDLGALQSDQSTALGARGQNLGALTADQAAQLGMRGQNLSALQGNQSTALGARGQDITQQLGMGNINATLRGQDANVLMSDADRALNAQDLGLRGQLGFGNLANTATGQGLDFLGQANQQGLTAEQMAQDAINNANRNQTMIDVANIGDPSLLESLGGPLINTAGRILFPGG